MKRAVIVALLLLAPGPLHAAAPPCSSGNDYADALCSFRRKDFLASQSRFARIVEKNETNPETMKSIYFLARSEMKLKRWDEAQTLLIRIYSLDPPFYRAWNCDFLLGEARAGAGK